MQHIAWQRSINVKPSTEELHGQAAASLGATINSFDQLTISKVVHSILTRFTLSYPLAWFFKWGLCEKAHVHEVVSSNPWTGYHIGRCKYRCLKKRKEISDYLKSENMIESFKMSFMGTVDRAVASNPRGWQFEPNCYIENSSHFSVPRN